NANGGRSVYSDGDSRTLGEFGMHLGYWMNYHIKFNSSSIQGDFDVNSVVGYVNFEYGNGTNPTTRQWQFANSADPTITSGINLFNSANLGYSNIVQVVGLGWRNATLYNPQGNDYIKNSIINNGYIAMAVVPSGQYQWNND